MAQGNASRAGETQPSLTLYCNRQAGRQHKRLCWLIVIVGTMLLANILATISGMGNPLYGAFHPAETPAGSTSTTTDSR